MRGLACSTKAAGIIIPVVACVWRLHWRGRVMWLLCYGSASLLWLLFCLRHKSIAAAFRFRGQRGVLTSSCCTDISILICTNLIMPLAAVRGYWYTGSSTNGFCSNLLEKFPLSPILCMLSPLVSLETEVNKPGLTKTEMKDKLKLTVQS